MTPRKTITLQHCKAGARREHETWRVEKVTNSIEYNPGDYLPKTDVSYLCHSGDWTVTIVGEKFT